MNTPALQDRAKSQLSEIIAALTDGDVRKALESARALCAVLTSLDRKAREIRQKTERK